MAFANTNKQSWPTHYLSDGPRLKKGPSTIQLFCHSFGVLFQKRLIFKSSGGIFLKKKIVLVFSNGLIFTHPCIFRRFLADISQRVLGTLWDPGTWGPREFGKDPSRPKIKKNAFCFLQFLMQMDRFRDICQKPPENAWVGENKPIRKH